MNTVYPSSMPFDDVKIIDQSGYVEETVVETPYIPEGPVAFMPFISPRGYGDDNKLQYMTASKLAKYGSPNLKKYGLSLYLAKRFADGGGTVLGMRVVPDSWAYANLLVSATVSKRTQCNFQTVYNSINGQSMLHPVFTYGVDGADYTTYFDELTISDPAKYAEIYYNGKVVENGTKIDIKVDGALTSVTVNIYDNNVTLDGENVQFSLKPQETVVVRYNTSYSNTLHPSSVQSLKDHLKTILDQDSSEVPSTIGSDEITIPLFAVAAKGAGLYGNAFRVRYTIDTTMNSYNDSVGGTGFFYKFIDSDNNAALDNAISFTFNDDYLYNGESMNIEESFAKYTENVVMVKSDKLDEFRTLIQNTCYSAKNDDGEYITNIENIDLLFGSNTDQSVYYVDRISEDAVDLSLEEGFRLKGGLEETDKTSKEFKFSKDIYAEAIANAYNGGITDLIYDHVRYPYQFIFAPSCDEQVVNAIHNLVTVNRKCTRAHYFVTGATTDVPATYQDARAAVKTMPQNSWKEDTIPEWARITDPFTGKKTFMPSVYFTAYAIPRHWNNRKGKPLAGRLNAIWSGFDVGTVTPSSANTNEYVLNHNAGLNTMIEDGIGNAEMYEQITSQATTSRLSEINNAQVLCEMVKIALKQAKAHRWTDLGDTDISEYKNSVEGEISGALNGSYQTMEVVAQRESNNGAGRNRILCKINVLFKDMFKGVSYEFYILAQ